MNALFSPFRKKEQNPTDWESKIKFWRSAIDSWCYENNKCVLNASVIESAFTRNGLKPQCIPTVIDNLLRDGRIQPKDYFLSLHSQQTWAGWLMNSLVKKPMIWSFSKLKDALLQPQVKEEEYIYLSYLKERGTLLFKLLKRESVLVMSKERVGEILTENDMEIPLETVSLILHWLQIENKVCVMTLSEDKYLVKVADDSGQTPTISDKDIAFYSLLQNKICLEKNIDDLEKEKLQTLTNAKEYLKKEMRQSAKNCLRKRMLLEKCIDQRSSTLSNLESLIFRIHNAESDAQVFNSYKMAVDILKTTFKNENLDEDSAMNALLDVQEVLDVHDDIQAALSQPLEPSVDEELQQIIDSLNTENDDTSGINMPSVPVNIDVPDKAPKEQKKEKKEALVHV